MKTNSPKTNRKIWLVAAISFALILLAASPQMTLAQQWATNGNDISNTNTGKVGVGTTSPGAKLHISGAASGVSPSNLVQFAVENSGSAGIQILNPDNQIGRIMFGTPSSVGNGGPQPGISALIRWDYANKNFDFATDQPNGYLRFLTSTFVERMRINANGNVGIGTTAPVGKLQIVDGNHVNVYTSPGYAGTFAKDGLTVSSNPDVGYSSMMIFSGHSLVSDRGLLRIRRNDGYTTTEALYVRMDGNVGIGTTGPNYKLDVNGEINATGLRINGAPISSAVDSVFGRAGAVVAATNDYTWAQINKTTSSLSDLATRSAGDLSSGTLPDARFPSTLPAASGANLTALNASSLASGTVGTARLGSGTANSTTFLRGDNTWVVPSGGQWTNGSNSIYYNSGNVGIGNDSPSTKLQVAGGTRVDGTNGRLYLGTGAVVGARGLEIIEENATTFSIRHHDPNVAWQNLALNPYAGRVGVGTLSPTETLEVSGNLKVSASASGPGNITAIGTITGGNIQVRYQDVAEWVPSSEQIASCTVVVLDSTKSNQVISSTQAYDTRVAGVISEQPGITLGESGKGKVLVATTGRVRVRVDATRGPIHIGDLLVTSDVPGIAMKSEPVNLSGIQLHRPGTIIGKALEPLEKGKGEILVLLSLQ